MEDFIGLYYPLFPPRCCTFEASQRVLRNTRYSASYFSLQIRTLIVPHSTQSVNPERVVCAGAEEEVPPDTAASLQEDSGPVGAHTTPWLCSGCPVWKEKCVLCARFNVSDVPVWKGSCATYEPRGNTSGQQHAEERFSGKLRL